MSAQVFSRTDHLTDSEHFYNSILDLLDDRDEKDEVDQLLIWAIFVHQMIRYSWIMYLIKSICDGDT